MKFTQDMESNESGVEPRPSKEEEEEEEATILFRKNEGGSERGVRSEVGHGAL